jgi:hypothetical protein
MSRNETRARRGRAAVERHPDFAGLDFETAAADTIADVLHACERYGGTLPSGIGELVDQALRTYEGDAEDDEPQHYTARLVSVYAEVMRDDSPNTSWLEQTPAQLGSLSAAVANRRRLRAYNKGEWWLIGLQAVAEVEIMDNRRGVVFETKQVRSGGLWGIESDSGEDYLDEVAREEIDQLTDELATLGLEGDGWRAIVAQAREYPRLEDAT